MPAPTIQNFFGSSATIVTGSATLTGSTGDPLLVIKYSDFVSQGWNAIATGDEAKPEKWIAAIVRKIKDFSASNTDDLANVVVNDPFIGLETRNELLKRRFSYSVDIYQTDSGANAPDPDLI